MFKALADPGRVRIVNLLATAGEAVCVCDLTPQLDLSQPTVSFHLKKLVAAGLARASSEMVGRRRRTIYAITPKGRRALGKWVPAPGDGPVIEFEQLIKVFFAEHGSKEDLLATLAAAREWSTHKLAGSAALPKAYLGGAGPFPERLPWLILVGQFLADFWVMVEQWADWAAEIVETWPEDLSTAPPDWKTLEMLERITADRAAE